MQGPKTKKVRTHPDSTAPAFYRCFEEPSVIIDENGKIKSVNKLTEPLSSLFIKGASFQTGISSIAGNDTVKAVNEAITQRKHFQSKSFNFLAGNNAAEFRLRIEVFPLNVQGTNHTAIIFNNTQLNTSDNQPISTLCAQSLELVKTISSTNKSPAFLVTPDLIIDWHTYDENFNFYCALPDKVNGLPLKELLIFWNVDNIAVENLIRQAEKQKRFRTEFPVNCNNEVKWIELDAIPAPCSENTAVFMGYLVILKDISESREQQLKEQNALQQLNERVKELNGIHLITRFLFDEDKSIPEVLKEVCKILPTMFQYPELVEAKVSFDDIAIATTGFNNSELSKQVKFRLENKRGYIKVEYPEDKFKDSKQELFLPEENDALYSVANLLKSFLKQKEVIKSLKESQSSYYELFNQVGNALYVLDKNGCFLDVNKAAEELYGYSKEEIIGKTPEFLSAPGMNDMPKTLELIREALEGKKQWFEWWGKRKDETIFSKEVVLNNARFFGRDVIIADGRNITKWKDALEKIKKNEGILSSMAHNFPGGTITIVDKNYIIEFIDGQELEKYDYTKESIRGKNILETFPESKNYKPELKDKLESIFQGNTLTYERRFSGKVYMYNGIPLKDSTGKVQHAMIISQNVTEQKEIEQKLREREQLIKSINSSIIEGIYRSTPDGKIIYANDAFMNLFGFSMHTELNEVHTSRLYADPSQRNQIMSILASRKRVRNEEVEFCKLDGSRFWALVNITRNTDQKGNVYYDGAINDISERKKIEKSFKEEKSFSDSVIHSLPGVFYMFDDQLRLYRWNKNLEKLTGYSPAEIKELTPFDLTADKDDEAIKEKISKVFENGEIELINGHLKDKEGTLTPFMFSGIRFYQNYKPYLLGVGMDISEQVNAEIKAKDSLREKEILLKEIHHRVKNNLAIIHSLLYLQSQKLSSGELKNMFLESQNRILSMSLVHEKLYQSKSLSQINIKKYLDELIQHINNTFLSENQNIQTKVLAENIKININKAVPCGLLINELLSNCFKHAFKNSTKGEIEVNCQKCNNGQIQIKITDNGIGLPENFDFSSNSSLGMNLIVGLADQIDGDLSFKSDNGTSFTITFKP